MSKKVIQLEDPVTELKYISDKYKVLLEKLNIHKVKDLLAHLPRYHTDTSEIHRVAEIAFEGSYTVRGNIRQFNNIYTRSRKNIQKAYLEDSTGKIPVTWFNQSFLSRPFKNDPEVILSGKVTLTKSGKPQMLSPQYDILKDGGESIHLGRITPTYPLTTGISIKWLRKRMKELLENYELKLESPTDNFSSIKLAEALQKIHFPESEEDVEVATERLSYEELISVLLRVIISKQNQDKEKSPIISIPTDYISEFKSDLPFELTADQESAVAEILNDISNPEPMNRLVQGDVGSGKTIVGLIASLAVLKNNFQVALLAPTVVLAEQHFNNIKELINDNDINIELITGSTKKGMSISSDKPTILIGTTAILARKEILLENLGLVIVDEQHRFGVNQREELKQFMSEQEVTPHLLDMTATPIPRTIALTFFGDVDVATIKSKPKGRLPINTRIIPQSKRNDSYKWIEQQIESGRQVYWICPLVEESEKLEIKSTKEIFEHLSQGPFKKFNVGLLHGRLKDKEKVQIMSDFKEGKIDLLVSTTVIEVGVDVANATAMIIEDADRMGLAQLHQIRGRVGRNDMQSWCFVYESKNISEKGKDRLRYFATHLDGLEIAEYDLELRGPGEVYGTRQSGIPDLKIAKLNDLKVIEKSKQYAQKLFESGVESLPLFN